MSLSDLSTKQILARLREYRINTVRKPAEVCQLGEVVIERNWTRASNDEVWTFLEQVGGAAVECGKLDLAEVCAQRLSTKFPGSPRVSLLVGAILEANEEFAKAKTLYENGLKQNENDLNLRKRLIALHLNSSATPSTSHSLVTTSKVQATPSAPSAGLSREKGVAMLVEYLDTFYNDAEGWAQLATVYADLQMFGQSLSALSHLILLAPHNPFHLLLHAETAYTLADYPLAYKEFLRVIEMSDGVNPAGGVGRRAAMGAKLCIARMESNTSTPIAEPLLRPHQPKEVDLLVTKLVLDAYSTQGAKGADAVRKWIGE